jgi:hypothetical protein
MYFFLIGGKGFFSGVVALDESLGARDQVDVEIMEARERFIAERPLETISDMEGELLRLFSAVNRNGSAKEGRRGGGGEGLEPERLVVRCLEANVEPHIEALSGPDTDRDEEVIDKRLVERLCGSFDPDRARRVAEWTGWGGASLPREGIDRDDTDR